jgi:hypothetical protein
MGTILGRSTSGPRSKTGSGADGRERNFRSVATNPRERTDTEIEAALQNGQRVLKINSMS